MRISNNELFLQYSDIKKGGTEVSFSFFCRPFIPQFGIKKITGGGEASPGYAADVYPFSHLKISCFRAKAHLVFHWGLFSKNTIFKKYYGVRTLHKTSNS